MSSKNLLPVLNYAQCAEAVTACVRARRTPIVFGPPGTAKTSMARQIAERLGLPCHILIGSNMDPTDVAGLPYRDNDGKVRRELFPEIQAVVENPGILVLDEFTQIPRSLEGPMLRLALERNAGGTALHPDSRIIILANETDEIHGAIELSSAMINRLVRLHYLPEHEEVVSYFAKKIEATESKVVTEDEFQSYKEIEHSEFAALVQIAGDLLTLKPPTESVEAASPWGSPRAWEIGLDAMAARGGIADTVNQALLSGAVGPITANSYFKYKREQQHLPSVETICQDPLRAPMPATKDKQIAAIGLICGRLAAKDPWAAWAYANRLTLPECRIAAMAVMVSDTEFGTTPNRAVGSRARSVLMAEYAKMTYKKKV